MAPLRRDLGKSNLSILSDAQASSLSSGELLSRTRGLLLALASTVMAAGFIAPQLARLGRSSDSLLLSEAIVSSAILLWWCKADAAARNLKPVAPRLVAFLTPIGLPYYFFRTRTVGGALASIGKALLLYLGLLVLNAICTALSMRLD